MTLTSMTSFRLSWMLGLCARRMEIQERGIVTFRTTRVIRQFWTKSGASQMQNLKLGIDLNDASFLIHSLPLLRFSG